MAGEDRPAEHAAVDGLNGPGQAGSAGGKLDHADDPDAEVGLSGRLQP
jgi:hypothetical protein